MTTRRPNQLDRLLARRRREAPHLRKADVEALLADELEGVARHHGSEALVEYLDHVEPPEFLEDAPDVEDCR